MKGFATKEGPPQELEVLGFFPSLVGLGPCISSEFKLPRFLLSQLQMELPQAITEAVTKKLGIRLVLETRQEIIRKTEQIRFAPTLPTNPALEPDIQDIMEVDRVRSHFSDQAASKARCEVAIRFNLFHRPALSYDRNRRMASALARPQKRLGPCKRKLPTRRTALSIAPLPIGSLRARS